MALNSLNRRFSYGQGRVTAAHSPHHTTLPITQQGAVLKVKVASFFTSPPLAGAGGGDSSAYLIFL
jgi:hypothetical protein